MTTHEKVILVGVETEKNYQTFSASMEELANLTETANGEVVFVLTQKRPQVDRQTVIGKGKLEELIQLTDAYEADLVIFNHELTPRQNQLLSEALAVRVIDRVQLILDIFALRARSKEGKLQVELAQLDYLLPRLAGQGKQLSRLGGGIGTRGPGETKLESDRRHIRNKILGIRRELKEVTAHRERSRQKRQNSELFQIGLIGYTNAGKSTIMNVLTNKNQYEADELFATLDATTKSVNLIGRLNVTLTDTVGFIQDLPTELVSSFKSTLEESKNVDLLVHVIDASDPNHEEHEKTVLAIMKDLDMLDIPRLTLYNKADKAENFTPTLTPYVLISAKKENSRAVLQEALLNKMRELFVPFWIKVSPSKAYKLHELESLSIIDKREYLEESETLSGYIAEKNKWRLEEFYD